MPWWLSGCRINSNLTPNETIYGEGQTNCFGHRRASAQQSSGAQIDQAHIGAVSTLRSEAEVLLYVERQLHQAQEVAVVYEAGPLGYGLYRKITALGAQCYVCGPQSEEQRKKRCKTNAIAARNLAGKLFNYLGRNQNALVLARVPTEAQPGTTAGAKPAARSAREGAQAPGGPRQFALMAQGFGSWSNWWRPRVHPFSGLESARETNSGQVHSGELFSLADPNPEKSGNLCCPTTQELTPWPEHTLRPFDTP